MRKNTRKNQVFLTVLFAVFSQFFFVEKARAQWAALGGGACDIVYSSCPDVAGTGIYFGQYYGNCAPTTKCFVQHWNGATISNLNATCFVNGFIYAMVMSGNNLYIAGDFTSANGVAGYNGVACWNTSTNTWSTLGAGLAGSNKTGYALCVDATNNILYVGGEFATAGGVTVNNVAAWNMGSSSWSAMGGTAGVSTAPGGTPAGAVVGVYALTYCNSKLYVGGRFVNAGGAAANSIAAWNGGSWLTLTGGGQIGVSNTTYVNPPNVASPVWDAPVMALTNDGTTVYVGGDFNKVNNATGCNNIAAWNTGSSTWSTLGNGLTWPALGSTATDNTYGDQANVYCLTMFNGNLIAGGDFMKAGTVGGANTDLFVAQWNGSAWSAMSAACGGHIESDVFTLCVSNGTLYAGGQFPEDIPNTPANLWYIAKYSGGGPTITLNVGTGTTICSGNSVALSASGATSYTWATGTGLSCTVCSNPTASPTSTTVYTVTGTSSGCNSSKTVTVTVVATPTLTVSGTTNLCQSASTVLTASTAASYTWSANAGGVNTNTTSVTPGLGTTVYTVTGSNGSGCTSVKTVSVNVVAPPTVTLSANSYTICNGSSTGLSANGATTYTWTNSTGLSNPNSATPTASPTTTTVYTVTGTTSGCNSSPVTATVNVTPLPTLTTSATSNTLCSTSSATLTVGGASTYTWSPAGSLSSANGSPVVATPTATTSYTVTGTNSGCNNTGVLTITVNPLPTINISPSAATVCPTGSATLAASGGSTYTWSPASTLNTANGGTVVATPTASTIYTVTGTSVAGCTNTNTVSVAVNPTLAVSVNSPTTCSGVGVVLTANGASSYSWSPAGGLSSTTGQTVTATGTTSIQYTVTGTSAGCVGSNTSIVTINPQPSLTVSATNTTLCSGSSATLTASGASTYSWAPAGSLNSSSGSAVVATPTTSVTYFVFGTDLNGCGDTNQVSITVTPPPDVSATPATICSGQSSTITVIGSATSYAWSANAGGVNTSTVVVSPTTTTVYTVTITSGPCVVVLTPTVTVSATPTLTLSASSYTICSGDSTPVSATGAATYTWTTGTGLNCTSCATPTANPTSTTIYTVTGDSSGCLSAPATVTVNVNQPPDVSAVSNTASVCVAASATLTVSGASNYTWSPVGSLNSTTGSLVVATPTANTTYTVIGTDVNGCRDTSTINVALAATPTISINPVPAALCAGQSLVLSGGTANTYTWSSNAGGANTGTITINPTTTDTYTLIGNIGSCTDTATVTVPVNPNPVITSSVVTSAPCGQSTGCVDTVVVNSGTPTYTYSWNGGSGSVTPQYCGQPSGIYTLTVTDANGCTVTQNINIPSQNGPTAPAVTASTNTVCVGGIVTMTVNPATSGIVYTWTDNTGTYTGTTYTISSVSPVGNYTLTVTATDTSINCSNNTSTSITVVGLPNITLTAADTTICAGQNTIITANGASSYTWSANAAGATTATVSVNPSVPTTYTVTGETNGCNDTATFSVGVNPIPSVTVNGNPNAVCPATTVTLTASGATSFTWMPSGANTATITDSLSSSTTYTVIGVDGNGCISAQNTFTISVNPTPTLAVTGSQSACSGGQINTINYNSGNTVVSWTNTNSNVGIAPGGSGNINGYTAPNVSVTETGVISAIPTDTSTGCSGSAQDYTVTIHPNPTLASIPNVDSAKCGVANGGVNGIQVTGGTPVYTYQWYDSTGIMNGQTDSSLSNVPMGTYTVVITDQNGCTVSANTTTFTINGTPAISTSITPPFSQGQAPLNISFSSVSSGATSYSWNFGNGQTANTQQPASPIIYTAAGTYTVILDVYNGGCHAMDTALVIIDATPNIIIPNVYSPNGDGINDTWFITATGYCKLHCEVYNRWGQLVYQLLAVNDEWNGVMNNGNHASEGTYYYILEATTCDGKTVTKSDGWITLVK